MVPWAGAVKGVSGTSPECPRIPPLGLQDFGASEWAPGSAGSRSTFGDCFLAGGWASLRLSTGEPGRQEVQPRGQVSLSGSLSPHLRFSVPLLMSVSVSPGACLSLSLPLPVSSLPHPQASLWAARRWQRQLNGPLVPDHTRPLG